MRKNQLHNRTPQLGKRKLLRDNLTKAEAVLWTMLKNSQLMGKKFRRQHGIEKFIIDFYCPSGKLIIELDGEIHNDPLRSAYDKMRQDRLEELGYKIIRFENNMVLEQTDAVLEHITRSFSQHESTTPASAEPRPPLLKTGGDKILSNNLSHHDTKAHNA